MIKFRVPATSANLGPGFDCLGVAFDLYNTFLIEGSDTLEINGVEERFNNADNLFVQAYRRAGGKNLKVTFCDTEIPVSRGLGSSAALITAGVTAYHLLHPDTLTEEEMFNIIADMEGHPDNAAPCLFGGLVGCLKKADGTYLHTSFPVNDHFCFTVLIPNVEVSTEQARKILPMQYSREITASSSAQAVFMLKALQSGDSNMLKEAAKDQIHEPYRKTLIPHFDDLKTIVENDTGGVLLISGSGSTCLLISAKPLSKKACEAISVLPEKWRIKETRPAYGGPERETDGIWHPVLQ